MGELPKEPPAREVTPRETYLRRRELIRQAGLFGLVSAASGAGLVALSSRGQADPPPAPPALPDLVVGGPNPWRNVAEPAAYASAETLTPFADITTYNNFYELGLSKAAPAQSADSLKPRPWTVRILGEVAKEMLIDVDELTTRFGLEERVYRMRCVEAWSMVIPWVGFPLAKLIEHVQPTSRAKFVSFQTLYDPQQLPGQKRDVLPWPYEEGLRIDEATHPLTLLAVGLYGAPLLGQNGAPIRLVVPWKYGFKGIKSIVAIKLTEKRPKATWNAVQPREYGFYANVNPEVSHPRWSQATERRIGQIERIPTLKFNGYGEQVAHMYRGMDLSVDF